MSIIDIAKKQISIETNYRISDAIRIMHESKISRLIVKQNKKTVGIISEKDIGLFLFSENAKQSLDKISISNIMKPIKFTNKDTTPEDAAKQMIENEISSLIIQEGNEELIFTKTDLVRFFSKNPSTVKVVDSMTKTYEFTYTSAPLYKVVRKMLTKKVSRLVVKDQNQKPVGIISFRDLFRISLELGCEEDFSGISLSKNIREGFLSETGFGNTSLTRDVMSKGIISVKFNETLTNACQIILENNVSGLAVLDGNEGIVGIISKTDVIRALASR